MLRLAQWPAVRRLLFMLSEKRAPGVRGGVLCRKCYIDAKTVEAANAGINTFVNLGAGLDTRVYRLPELAESSVFEVDLPENIAYKTGKLQRLYGMVPAHVRLVPMDFCAQDLEGVLSSSGYQKGQKAFFMWEAITQYLPETAVRNTFAFLAQALCGSRLVFTYIRQDFMEGTMVYGLDALYQGFRVKEHVWQFGLAPEEVASFLHEYSWQEGEQVGSQEYTARYLKPWGRVMPVTDRGNRSTSPRQQSSTRRMRFPAAARSRCSSGGRREPRPGSKRRAPCSRSCTCRARRGGPPRSTAGGSR